MATPWMFWRGSGWAKRFMSASGSTALIRPNCGAVAKASARAREARSWLVSQLAGRSVALRQVRFGKYAGRVVARVELEDGQDLSTMLLRAGLARAYDGRKRADWCG